MNPTMDYLIAMKDIYKVPFNDSEKELLKLLISKTSSPLIYEAPEDLEFLIGTRGVGYLKEKADDTLRLEPLSGVTKDGWSSPDKSVPLNVTTSLDYFFKYLDYKYSQPILAVSPYGDLSNHPLNLFINKMYDIIKILPEVITDYVEYSGWRLITVPDQYIPYINLEESGRKDIIEIE